MDLPRRCRVQLLIRMMENMERYYFGLVALLLLGTLCNIPRNRRINDTWDQSYYPN